MSGIHRSPAELDAYHSEMAAILDMSDKLPLVHEPDAIVRGNPYAATFDTIAFGRPIAEHDRSTPEGSWAYTYEDIGVQGLRALGRLAVIRLVPLVLPTEGLDQPQRDSPEYEQFAEKTIRGIYELTKTADYTYSTHRFTIPETNETLEIGRNTAQNDQDTLHASVFDLTIRDDSIRRTLNITKFRTTPDLPMFMDADQTIEPARSPRIQAAYDLMKSIGAAEDVATLNNVFLCELREPESSEPVVSMLLDRYAGHEKIESIRELISRMISEARLVRESHTFIAANPGLNAPTAEELSEYRRIFSSTCF